MTVCGRVEHDRCGADPRDPQRRIQLCAEPRAVGESSVILLHPPLPPVGVSTGMERGCRHNDSIASG